MKNYSLQTLLAMTSVISSSLAAQTTINPPTNVPSYTNADLTPTTPSSRTNPMGTPDVSTQAGGTAPTPNQNAPFKYPALTADQAQQFSAQMNGYIQNSQQRVQNLMGRVQDSTRMPMSIDKVELEAAIMDLDVKKTLVAKFEGSPSLKSPKVRQALIQILSKDFVQAADLATLQTIVNDERPYTYP